MKKQKCVQQCLCESSTLHTGSSDPTGDCRCPDTGVAASQSGRTGAPPSGNACVQQCNDHCNDQLQLNGPHKPAQCLAGIHSPISELLVFIWQRHGNVRHFNVDLTVVFMVTLLQLLEPLHDSVPKDDLIVSKCPHVHDRSLLICSLVRMCIETALKQFSTIFAGNVSQKRSKNIQLLNKQPREDFWGQSPFWMTCPG